MHVFVCELRNEVYVCVRARVRACVRVWVCMYVCMHVCMYAYVRVCMFACMYVREIIVRTSSLGTPRMHCIDVLTRMHVHTSVFKHARVRVHYPASMTVEIAESKSGLPHTGHLIGLLDPKTDLQQDVSYPDRTNDSLAVSISSHGTTPQRRLTR